MGYSDRKIIKVRRAPLLPALLTLPLRRTRSRMASPVYSHFLPCLPRFTSASPFHFSAHLLVPGFVVPVFPELGLCTSLVLTSVVTSRAPVADMLCRRFLRFGCCVFVCLVGGCRLVLFCSLLGCFCVCSATAFDLPKFSTNLARLPMVSLLFEPGSFTLGFVDRGRASSYAFLRLPPSSFLSPPGVFLSVFHMSASQSDGAERRPTLGPCFPVCFAMFL